MSSAKIAARWPSSLTRSTPASASALGPMPQRCGTPVQHPVGSSAITRRASQAGGAQRCDEHGWDEGRRTMATKATAASHCPVRSRGRDFHRHRHDQARTPPPQAARMRGPRRVGGHSGRRRRPAAITIAMGAARSPVTEARLPASRGTGCRSRRLMLTMFGPGRNWHSARRSLNSMRGQPAALVDHHAAGPGQDTAEPYDADAEEPANRLARPGRIRLRGSEPWRLPQAWASIVRTERACRSISSTATSPDHRGRRHPCAGDRLVLRPA